MVINTLAVEAVFADLVTEQPQAVRLQRLVGWLRAQFRCGAVALLRLEEDHLRPVAVDGLVGEALGRRFAVGQHPRLAAILARSEVTCFDHDSQLPDPYDGLLDALVGEPLPVHDCMGVGLRIDGQPWGVLTLDALQTGTFDAAARTALQQCRALVETVLRISRLEQENRALAARHDGGPQGGRAVPATPGHLEIVGQSDVLTRLLHEMQVVAGSDLPVLLLGETGVGKELFARALFRNSARAAKPFITVDCASLPETLVESHLFGHSRGAFTGADRARDGLLLAADRGTLFLDEVGDLPQPMQGVFLRALEQRRFRPVGEVREVSSDFRLVAATNKNLELMAKENSFRSDLLYRLQGITIVIPPLRERLDEIPALARQTIAKFCLSSEQHEKTLSDDALGMLLEYAWTGNVRELENVVQRAVIFAVGDVVQRQLPGLEAPLLHRDQTQPDGGSTEGVLVQHPLHDLFQRGDIHAALPHHVPQKGVEF